MPLVYVVDDGSTDMSGEAARKAGATLLRHPDNRGKGAALKTGFARILAEDKWDAVVILDGDGQHDSSEIPRFVSCSQHANYDIVVGDRMGDVRPMPFRRKATNFLCSQVLSALTRQRIRDTQCGFRLIKTKTLKDLVLKTSQFDTESEMLLQAAANGARIGNLSIVTIYGAEKSSVHPVLDTWRFIRLAGRFLVLGRFKRMENKSRRETC